MFSPNEGKGNGRGISGFAVNRGAVNWGFTVPITKYVKKNPGSESADREVYAPTLAS